MPAPTDFFKSKRVLITGSRAVSGDSPGTPRGACANTQDFQICASSNLCAAYEHTRIRCLRRVVADSTRVACSTREKHAAGAWLAQAGEYIGRIFLTANKRPQFVVKEVVRSGPPADTKP